ncbi:MAG: TrmH family RNA methyltransferase [bacterium]|nr:TrmH family RNA methyltransferase [bacterium]
MKLNAKQLRATKPSDTQLAHIQHRPIYIVLDNVMDTYNIGSLFRLADAVAAREIILTGNTETPPNSRIHKAAVGTEEWVKWQYFDSAKSAISNLKSRTPNIKVIAVEQSARSVSISDFNIRVSDIQPVAIVVGHETEGVGREVLDLADKVVEIPMFGVNKSLNVVVSTGIVLSKIEG